MVLPIHPKIAREWNKERNGDLKPTDVIANSNKRVWWKCKEGHEWSGLIVNRARKGKADPGCPYCSGRKVLAGYNDLATTHPGMLASILFSPFPPMYLRRSRHRSFADPANADAPLPASLAPPSRRRRRATRPSGGTTARLSL